MVAQNLTTDLPSNTTTAPTSEFSILVRHETGMMLQEDIDNGPDIDAEPDDHFDIISGSQSDNLHHSEAMLLGRAPLLVDMQLSPDDKLIISQPPGIPLSFIQTYAFQREPIGFSRVYVVDSGAIQAPVCIMNTPLTRLFRTVTNSVC